MRLQLAVAAVASCAAHGLAQQWVFLDGPYAAGRGIAWDSRRQRAVAFGSEGETWEYDGTARLHRPTTVAPFPRNSHAMVYDAARGQTLLFGGTAARSVGDTWLWDGCSWQSPFFAVVPPRRSNAGIAFDSARNRVVMFGGQDISNNTDLSDTWEFDGTQWLRQTPATVPNPNMSPQLAYDSARSVAVLMATSSASSTLSVFEWNGANWTARTSSTSPPTQRSDFSVAYDRLRQRTVLFGGSVNGNELWEWDGSAWHLMFTAPVSLARPGMYFDTQRRVTVIVGGEASVSAAWTWNGTTFANLWPERSPSVHTGYAMFRDDARGRTVLFGGRPASSDTWEWDGSSWTMRTPAVSPPGRSYATACYEPVSGTGLLFGGVSSSAASTIFGDCWRWDGTAWTQLVGPAPPPRLLASMAWDPVRNEVILFGGAGGGVLFDTWRWNGAAWSQAPWGPPPRIGAALAFDPTRGRMVLFGGSGQSNMPLNDTWEWNGNQWQQVLPAQSPPPLSTPGMVHDPARGRMLVVGVNTTSQPVSALEAWDYDGTTWTQVCTAPGSFAAPSHLVWDPQRQRAVLSDGISMRELTWVAADAAVLGTGCGPTPPLLSARTRPRTGDSQFGLELQTRANLPCLFALAFASGSTGIGNGCTLLLQRVAATTFVLANGNGMAVQPIPLPANQALRGLVVYAQSGALDPAAPGGLALSHSLRLTVGD